MPADFIQLTYILIKSSFYWLRATGLPLLQLQITSQ